MLSFQQGQKQSQQLAPAVRQSIRMLAMSLPDLRQEIVREIACNPLIEDVDHVLELLVLGLKIGARSLFPCLHQQANDAQQQKRTDSRQRRHNPNSILLKQCHATSL